MSYASDRQQASFRHAERSYDRMLAAGPPEPAKATVNFRATVFAEGPYDSAEQVEAWLRERLTKNATVTLTSEPDDETVIFDIGDELEEVESVDYGTDLVNDLIVGGDHDMALKSIEIDDPEAAYEPDWDAINKDRRLDAMDW